MGSIALTLPIGSRISSKIKLFASERVRAETQTFWRPQFCSLSTLAQAPLACITAQKVFQYAFHKAVEGAILRENRGRRRR